MRLTDSENVEEEVKRRLEKTMIEAGGWAELSPPGDEKEEAESRFDKVTKIVNGGGVVKAIIVKCRDNKVRDEILRMKRCVKQDHGLWVNEQMTFEERARQRRVRIERRNRRFGLMYNNRHNNRYNNMYERGGVWGYRN